MRRSGRCARRRPPRPRVEGAAAQSGGGVPASAAVPAEPQSAAAATRSPSGHPERVAEEQLLKALWRVGREREQRTES